MSSNTDYTESSLRDEVVGISPQIGMVDFVGPTGGRLARGTIGLGLDLNMAPWFGNNAKDMYVGISTGGYFAHMGASGANFFGSNTDVPTGANMIIIPADLKLGYNMSDSMRISLHGGANAIYRSAAGAADMGVGSNGQGALWKIYPNVGADFEVQASKHLSFVARPDVTITSGASVLMGTIGATIIPSI